MNAFCPQCGTPVASPLCSTCGTTQVVAPVVTPSSLRPSPARTKRGWLVPAIAAFAILAGTAGVGLFFALSWDGSDGSQSATEETVSPEEAKQMVLDACDIWLNEDALAGSDSQQRAASLSRQAALADAQYDDLADLMSQGTRSASSAEDAPEVVADNFEVLVLSSLECASFGAPIPESSY